ncbi:carbohydrate-selective porin, putative [Microscilla marina ATCC 23134]|uniref:Carbohydrate-selective porin, putative n=2 Tax=Microscilla marina TaxID=1027 RepID=A1ZV33_MICM2|nr:carbohydrate-selective porin, putative [Microscilla marina ATCC 23134]
MIYAQEPKKRDINSITSSSGSKSPFDFTTIIQGDIFHNFDSGLQTESDYMGRVHLIISLDTKKAGLWKNGKLLVNGVNAHGGNPTATYIGDFQPISRNEAAPERTGLLGYYLITDQLIFPEDTKTNQGLGLFLQVAAAPGNQNLIYFFYAFGVNYTGLFSKRTQDILFLGFLSDLKKIRCANSRKYIVLRQFKKTVHSRSYEAFFEQNEGNRYTLMAQIIYERSLKFGKHLTIQPDL